jgi:hypothetical protein
VALVTQYLQTSSWSYQPKYLEIQSFFKTTNPACFLLLNQIVSTFPALRMQQENDFPGGRLIETPSGHQWTVKEKGASFS